ncbi:MAG: hypothetical protein SFX74_03325 [Fimbriimonadaceae bacterium]|nr:hypothetical protein [Fimbriimonadaceae bacterium]
MAYLAAVLGLVWWSPLLAQGVISPGFISPGQAGDSDKAPKFKPKPAATVDPVVTQADARRNFLRYEAILRTRLKIAGAATSDVPNSTKPVTRAQIVGTFARWHTMIEPKQRSTPTAVKFDAARLATRDPRLAKLVRAGFVAKIGPVSTRKTDQFTAREFGDAIGIFLARAAETTYMPSSKWTPILQPDNVGG